PEASSRPVATSVIVTRAPPTSSPSTIAPCATTRTITSVATGSVRSRGGLSSAAYATLIMNSAPARKGVSSFLTAGSFLLLLTFPRYSKSGGLADPLIRASCCLLGQCSIGRVPVLVQLRPSSEGLLRPRAPGAQDRHGRPSTSSRFASTGGSAWPPRPLLHLGPRLHVIQNGHQSDHLFVTGGQHHPWRLDPHELARVEIGDGHVATTDVPLGRDV